MFYIISGRNIDMSVLNYKGSSYKEKEKDKLYRVNVPFDLLDKRNSFIGSSEETSKIFSY